VAGLEGWPEVARSLGLKQVLIVDEAGQVYLTPAMAERVEFSTDVEQTVVRLDD